MEVKTIENNLNKCNLKSYEIYINVNEKEVLIDLNQKLIDINYLLDNEKTISKKEKQLKEIKENIRQDLYKNFGSELQEVKILKKDNNFNDHYLILKFNSKIQNINKSYWYYS